MSFSFSYVAKSKDHAKTLIKRDNYLPAQVLALVLAAIEGVPDYPSSSPEVWLVVKGSGHLADGAPNTYQRSSFDIVVEPLILSS